MPRRAVQARRLGELARESHWNTAIYLDFNISI